MDLLIDPSVSLLKYEEELVEDIEEPEPEEKEFDYEEEEEDVTDDEKEKEMQFETEVNLKHAARKILDCIAAPREVVRDGRTYRIQVNKTKATRDDLMNLEEQLDLLLKVRQARLVGLCPIRRELYEQCFDELIRQSALCSLERGALFLRIRDELRMTIAAHETLYESGVAYGLRKSLQEECSEINLDEMVQNAENELIASKERLKKLEVRIEQVLKVGAEQKTVMQARHEEKMQYLKKTNEQLRDQLEMMSGK